MEEAANGCTVEFVAISSSKCPAKVIFLFQRKNGSIQPDKEHLGVIMHVFAIRLTRFSESDTNREFERR